MSDRPPTLDPDDARDSGWSRHSRGDAANVRADGTPAHGHVDVDESRNVPVSSGAFRNVPTDEEFVGELDDVETWPYALTPEEIAQDVEERRLRRLRRSRFERWRARVILGGGFLVVVLMAAPIPGIYAAFALLATFVAAVWLRRAGQ